MTPAPDLRRRIQHLSISDPFKNLGTVAPASSTRGVDRRANRSSKFRRSESPPSSLVGFFFGSTPPENYSPTLSKLCGSPHGMISGSSTPVGSMPKPFPPFQHPSHQLLEEHEFKQQQYRKFHKHCLNDRKKLGIGCSEIVVDLAAPQDHAHGYGLLASSAKLIPEGELRLHLRVPDATPDNSGPNGLAVKCGKHLFIGRIPVGATAVDLRVHFSQFGHVLDVYLPKDDKKISHRGFGFVTFADDISAEYAFQKDHRILGQKIVLDRAAPL